MARISLGPATGTVAGAQDSKRLVGATPQMSSAGALAGRSINEPALQPQAAPVSTYFQPGAPTLGGPVRIAAPPDLPQPSQDLANLAKALGGISSSLGTWGETAIAFEKQRMASAEQKGKAAAYELTSQYPGQDFAAMRDTLYKRAQEGDAAARGLYERMQALSPLQLSYANRYVAMANLRSDLDTAGDRWARMTKVPGPNGVELDKETLRPDDPNAQLAMRSLLRIPNDPVVWKEFEPLIYSKYTQLAAAHSKVHADYKERTFLAAQAQAASAAMATPGLTTDQKALYLSKSLTDARIALGTEAYQKVAGNLMEQLRANAKLQSLTDDGRVDINKKNAFDAELSILQGKIIAGPNGETLNSYLGAKGGAVGIVEHLQKSMQETASLRNDINAVGKATGEDVAYEYAQRYGLTDPAIAGDQQAMNSRTIEANAAMAKDPRVAGNPVALRESQSTLQSIASGAEALGTKRVQDNFSEQAASIVNRSDLTGEQKVALLDQLAASGADATTIQGAMRVAQDERRRDGAPQANANKERINRIVKDRMTFLSRPGIDGIGLSDKEANQVIDLKAGLQTKLRSIESEVKAKGGSDADVAKAQREYLDGFGQDQTQAQAWQAAQARPPVVTDPNKFYEQRRMTPAQRRELNQAVKYGKVVDSWLLKAELESWVYKNTLSPQMKYIINQSGYGSKAGQFLRQQWNLNFPGFPLPAAHEERLNDLDGVKVSSAVAPVSGSGFAMVDPLAAQRNLISLGNRLFNRPAAAATLPAPVSPARPQQVAIRPVTASIGNFAVPVSGVGDTGKGYGVPGINDAYGRPVVLAQGAMNAFAQMVRDSKGAVTGADIASSQRSPAKNVAVGGAARSPHLGGRAMDLHGRSRKWVLANGAKYGWYIVDYEGSHGGHFEYRGR